MTDNNTKSGKRIYIFAGVAVALLLIALYFNFSKPKFEIKDMYTDSTARGKFVFIFVETKSQDKETMLNWSRELKGSGGFLEMPDKSKPALMTIYFYNTADTVKLNEDVKESLKKRYSNKTGYFEKINFVPNGWQYIGHNSPMIISRGRDSIFKTMVFVPKPGYKAYQIIKE